MLSGRVPRCVYINLDGATERRELVEASWPAPRGWTLERFPAIRHEGPAETRPGAIGCFLSHREVIRQSLGDDAPVLVVEDDVEFGPSTFAALDMLLSQPHGWEILLLDINPLDMSLLTMLAREREALAGKGLSVFDLRGRVWAGTTAYVVRGGAKQRLFDLLSGEVDRPIDLFLRKLCDDGKLSAAVCLPFLTTASPAARDSQIASTSWQAPLWLFRRLMWLDRDLDQCERDAEAMAAAGSAPGRVAGAVMARIIGVR